MIHVCVLTMFLMKIARSSYWNANLITNCKSTCDVRGKVSSIVRDNFSKISLECVKPSCLRYGRSLSLNPPFPRSFNFSGLSNHTCEYFPRRNNESRSNHSSTRHVSPEQRLGFENVVTSSERHELVRVY